MYCAVCCKPKVKIKQYTCILIGPGFYLIPYPISIKKGDIGAGIRIISRKV